MRTVPETARFVNRIHMVRHDEPRLSPILKNSDSLTLFANAVIGSATFHQVARSS